MGEFVWYSTDDSSLLLPGSPAAAKMQFSMGQPSRSTTTIDTSMFLAAALPPRSKVPFSMVR
jgi:hypothetical protein